MSILDIFKNKILITCAVSYLLAQFIKMVISAIVNKKLDLRVLFSNGGMPSSHTSTVLTLFIMCALTCGFDSVEAAITFIFCAVVIADATGVRQAAGKQAQLLNEISELLRHQGRIPGEKLKELLGHTPFEATMGAVLGAAVGLISFYLF